MSKIRKKESKEKGKKKKKHNNLNKNWGRPWPVITPLLAGKPWPRAFS